MCKTGNFVVWTTQCISLLSESMSLHSNCAAEGAQTSFYLEHKSDQEGEGMGLIRGVHLGAGGLQGGFGWQCVMGVGRRTTSVLLGRNGPLIVLWEGLARSVWGRLDASSGVLSSWLLRFWGIRGHMDYMRVRYMQHQVVCLLCCALIVLLSGIFCANCHL